VKTVVLDAYSVNPGDLSWEWLNRFGEAVVYPRTSPDEVIARAADAEAVLTNKVLLGEAELRCLPKLKYIGVLATGYNVVDLAAASSRGIVVTNIPAYSTASVAQSVFAHILNITNRVGHYAWHNKSFLPYTGNPSPSAAGSEVSCCRQAAEPSPSRWAESIDFCYYDTPLTELDGKVMGIVGYGRTGSRVASTALAFGMKVRVYTSKPQEALPEGVVKTALDDVFRLSDIVSLHCPLTPDTHHLVNASRLALMKPTAILINTSRGPVVDEQALADALRRGALQAAGVDVLDHEPPAPDCPLLTAPNCYITPHIAWATLEARQRLMHICEANLEAFAAGQPVNVVNNR